MLSPLTTPEANKSGTIYFWRETTAYGYLSNWYPLPFTSGPLPPSLVSSNPKLRLNNNNPSSSSSAAAGAGGSDDGGAAATLPNPPHQIIKFKTSEHHMMYSKALLFDPSVCPAVLSASHPREVKSLGRKIKNFDQAAWDAHKEEIVRQGNYFKFSYPVKPHDDDDDDVDVEGAPGRRRKKSSNKWWIDGKTLRQHLLDTGDKELVEASPYDDIWGIGFTAEHAEDRREEWGQNLLGKVLMDVREIIRAEEEEKKKEKEKN